MDTPEMVICDPLVGAPRAPEAGPAPTVDDLRAEMSRLRVRGALVRHRACVEIGAWFGNDVLGEQVAARESMRPVWALTPDGRGPDFAIGAAVAQMLAAGVRAAWMSPSAHLFSPLPWCAGHMYDLLQTARVPLLVRQDELSPDQVHAVCEAFGQLRLVLLRVGRLGRNRHLYPLLSRHENLHLCFDPFLSVFGGFGDLCRRFGEHRWVLGTGYPDAEGGAGITGLMYAGLDDQAVEAIAHGNIERLLKEVRHDAL